MTRGVPRTSTIRDAQAPAVWQRYQFPTMDVPVGQMNAYGDRWFAARNTLHKPYCWTPHHPFWFGGKQFIGLYPCVAGATRDHGFIIQKGPNGLIWGRE